MPRSINETSRLMAGMLAAIMTGDTYSIPRVRVPPISSPILDSLEAEAPVREAKAEAEAIEKARVKRLRKQNKKSVDNPLSV